MILRTNTTVSVKGTLGTNRTAELHIGGDAYGCDTEKEKSIPQVAATTNEMLSSVSDML